MKKRVVRIFSMLLVLAMTTSSLTACTIGNTKILLDIGLHNSNTAFVVDGNKCKMTEAKLYMCAYMQVYGLAYGMDIRSYDFDGQSLEDYVKQVAIAELGRIYSMDILAKQQGLSLSEDEVKKCKEAAKTYYKLLTDDEIEFADAKVSTVETAYEHYALAKKLYQSLTSGVNEEVSDDDARVIKVQQIYVNSEDTAKAVSKKLKAGEEFATVAATYNQESKVELTVARGYYSKAVEEIAFNLENDEISDVIETEDGYYFIKCLSKFEKDLTDANKEVIRQERENEQFEELYTDFISEAKYEENSEDINELVLNGSDTKMSDKTFFEVYDEVFLADN